MKISIYAAADKFDINYPALLAAANIGKIKIERCNNKIYVEEEDVKYYVENRYDRRVRKFNGKIIHDTENLSPYTASMIIGCDVQHIYYILYKNIIPFTKKGRWFIIKKCDAIKYKEDNKDKINKVHKNTYRRMYKYTRKDKGKI